MNAEAIVKEPVPYLKPESATVTEKESARYFSSGRIKDKFHLKPGRAICPLSDRVRIVFMQNIMYLMILYRYSIYYVWICYQNHWFERFCSYSAVGLKSVFNICWLFLYNLWLHKGILLKLSSTFTSEKVTFMKIITYNVNGIRAAISKGLIDGDYPYL